MADRGQKERTPLKPNELGALYPVPKSYDDLLKDTEERQERYATQRTKLPSFKIAFFGTALFTASAYYASTVELLWLIKDPIVMIFSYAIWGILLLFAIKWLRYTLNIFYEYSSRSLPFWIVYLIGLGAGIYVWQKGLWLDHTSYQWLIVLAGAHFLVTIVAALIFVKRVKTS